MFTSANWLISLSRTHIIVSDTLSLLALYDHIKPQNNEPLYSNTVIGTLAVDGWAVTFGTARMGLDTGCGFAWSLLAVPNVTTHPSTASVPTS